MSSSAQPEAAEPVQGQNDQDDQPRKKGVKRSRTNGVELGFGSVERTQIPFIHPHELPGKTISGAIMPKGVKRSIKAFNALKDTKDWAHWNACLSGHSDDPVGTFLSLLTALIPDIPDTYDEMGWVTAEATETVGQYAEDLGISVEEDEITDIETAGALCINLLSFFKSHNPGYFIKWRETRQKAASGIAACKIRDELLINEKFHSVLHEELRSKREIGYKIFGFLVAMSEGPSGTIINKLAIESIRLLTYYQQKDFIQVYNHLYIPNNVIMRLAMFAPEYARFQLAMHTFKSKPNSSFAKLLYSEEETRVFDRNNFEKLSTIANEVAISLNQRTARRMVERSSEELAPYIEKALRYNATSVNKSLCVATQYITDALEFDAPNIIRQEGGDVTPVTV